MNYIAILLTIFSISTYAATCPEGFESKEYFSYKDKKMMSSCIEITNYRKAVAPSSTTQSNQNYPFFEKMFRQLILGLLPISDKRVTLEEDFDNSKCEIDIRKWRNFLITQKAPKLYYQFRTGCSVEGEFTPQMNKNFPVNFNVRNLGQIKTVQMTLQIQVDPQPDHTMIVKIICFKGVASSGFSLSARFKGSYAIRIDRRGRLKKNIGGEFSIYSFNNVPVAYNRKLEIPFSF